MSLPRLLSALGAGAGTAAAAWLLGDFIHSRLVLARYARSTPRPPADPFTLNPAGSPAILLIHGFADSPGVFRLIAPLLANNGFAVRALLLSGSGVPPGQMAGLTLQTWRDDIHREIAALQTESPGRPVWLLGHSLGGTLAFDAALRLGPAVAGLILLAPLIEPSNARSTLLSARQWFRLLDKVLLFTRVVESRLPADLHDPATRPAYRTDKFIHRDIYRALFAAIAAIRPRAADWHGPLLAFLSPDDQIVHTPATRRFLEDARNARPLRQIELPAAGHVLPLEAGHPGIVSQITQFIRQTPSCLDTNPRPRSKVAP
ncbi:MAG: alpha/beta hydrolase [Lentisphaerae bacterium]|jgi:alpha-beta hydrolase superfamily lysophospholipase|nr:alpha/beta hydrolase [Lentisphaerota bacterium]